MLLLVSRDRNERTIHHYDDWLRNRIIQLDGFMCG